MKTLRYFLVLLLPLAGIGNHTVQAQNTIQTTLMVNPPYSNQLSEYISGFDRRITLVLTGNADVRLTGTLRSNTGVAITLPEPLSYYKSNGIQINPVTIRGQKRISGIDISNMFTSDPTRNTSTVELKRGVFGNSFVLPEGDYELCMKVFDGSSDRQLGNEVCRSFTIQNIEPPYLLSPIDRDTLTSATATFQPVQFQWTFPAGAQPARIEYVLQIAELRAGQNPYNVFESGPPFAEIVVPNANPVYFLKANDPRFELGQQYAWRVRVRGKGQYEGLTNFQNNGLSTVNTFVYGAAAPDNLVTSSEQVIGAKSIPNQEVVPNNLGGQCACKFPTIPNQTPVDKLGTDQTVYIGKKDGYQLKISTITQNGNAFTGTGTVILGPDFKPSGRSGAFIPLAVTFNDIKVNSDGVLIAGQVQSKKGDGQPSLLPTLAANPTLPDPAAALLTSQNWGQVSTKITNDLSQLASQQANGAGFVTPFGYASGPFTMAFDNVIFTPTSAQFDALTVIEERFSASPVSIPLGLKGACLPIDGCTATSVLYLLKDVPIGGGLTLKGGTDAANATYFTFNLDKSKATENELTIAADYIIPKATSLTDGDPVVAQLRTKTKDGFDNWLAEVSVSTEFKMEGIDDFSFLLTKATYDHDASRNPAGFADMLAGLTKDGVQDTKLANLQKDVWQGFYMDELRVTLPGVFQSTQGKTSVAVKNLLIGNGLGLSGSLGGGSASEPVIKYEDGSLDGWYFSLETIGITFFDGTFVKANADGKIGLPISGKDEKAGLVYTNTLTSSEAGGLKYIFNVKPQEGGIDVPIWAAKFNLSEASVIQVTVGKTDTNPQGGVWAGADLSGKLTMNVDFIPKAIGVKMPSFDLGLMEFQHLKIQSKGPRYIDWGDYKSQAVDGAGKTISSFAGAFASPQKGIMGLPLTIEQFGPVLEGSKVGFAFTGALALSDMDIKALPKASASLRILANIGLKDGRPDWSFDGVYLDSVKVSGAIGPMSIAGALWFYRSHEDYGDGLGGNLKATFPMNIGVGAEVRFGTWKDNSYWYVGAAATGLTVPVGAGLMITGFGGGAYHNMTAPPPPKADQLLASTAKLTYKPNAGSNGFTASVYLATLDGSILKADGTLGVQFDKDWGLDQISIVANAHLICADVGISDKVKQGMADGTASIVYKVPDAMFDLGAQVTASIANMIKLTGTLAVHVGPDGYYIKLGEPNNRIKVTLMAPGIGINLGEATSYFVMGTLDMPNTLPDPIGIDPGLLAQVGYRKPAVDFKSGLAFGSALEIGSTDKHRFLIFYLKLQAEIGFDVIMGKTQGNCTAAENGGQPGINGYYAMGQIYAGVDFSFGVGVDLWFVSGDFDVATVRAGAIFTGGLPNPTWMRGILYGEYNILDGLVTGNMSFRLKIGTICIPDTDTNPFKMPLISGVSPATNEKDVSILKNPVVSFNYPVNQDICVSKPIDENGALGTDCYKVEFSMTTTCGGVGQV